MPLVSVRRVVVQQWYPLADGRRQEETTRKVKAILNLLIATSAVIAQQQSPENKRADVYQHVPDQQRKLLTEAIEKLVAAEKARDWKTVYDLIDKNSRDSESRFLSETKHLRRLLEFVPTKVTFMPADGSWNIQGCARFEGDPKNHGHIADVTAQWLEARWYLSLVAYVPFGSEKEARILPCSIP